MQDIDDYYFAAVTDKKVGFNAGVLLINLKKWREDNLEKKFFEYAKENMSHLRSVDQEILNNVCGKGIKSIDKKFNFIPELSNKKFLNDDEDHDAIIVHFAGTQKPWINTKIFGYRKFCYFAKKTSYQEEIFKPKINYNSKITYLVKYFFYGALSRILANRVNSIYFNYCKYKLIVSL